MTSHTIFYQAMKQKCSWLFNLPLRSSSCGDEQPYTARSTSTELPDASACAFTAVATASARVEDWVMEFLPQCGPEAGFGVGIDEDVKRIELSVNPKALAMLTNTYHFQTPEPIPQAYWPSSLREALIGIDPDITVVLIPDVAA